jgi:hypothetical protein
MMKNTTLGALAISLVLVGCAVEVVDEGGLGEIDGDEEHVGAAERADTDGAPIRHAKAAPRRADPADACAKERMACEAEIHCSILDACMMDCREACDDEGSCVSECVAGEAGCLSYHLFTPTFKSYLSCQCESGSDAWLNAPACP